jgi:hypothetical protein
MQHLSSDQLLEEGITLCFGGDKAAAFDRISQAAQLNPYNERAWLWLGGLTTNRDERIFYLNQVLLINPQNQAALEGLRELGSTPQSDMPILPSILAPHKDSSAGKATVRLQSPDPAPDESSPQASTRTTRVLATIPHGADEPRLVSLIVDELSAGRRKNEVIQKVAETSWLNWEHAEELVDFIAKQEAKTIRSRYSWIFILFGAIFLIIAGLIAWYAWLIQPDFSQLLQAHNTTKGTPSGLFILLGTFLVFNTWIKLDIFMFCANRYSLEDLFGSFISRIIYFVLGIGLIFLGFTL